MVNVYTSIFHQYMLYLKMHVKNEKVQKDGMF